MNEWGMGPQYHNSHSSAMWDILCVAYSGHHNNSLWRRKINVLTDPFSPSDSCWVKFIPMGLLPWIYKLSSHQLHLHLEEARAQLVLGSGAVVPLGYTVSCEGSFSADLNEAFFNGMKNETLGLTMVVRNPEEIFKIVKLFVVMVVALAVT